MTSSHENFIPPAALWTARALRLSLRVGRWTIAWACGVVSYLMVMVVTVYDGGLHLITQPVIGMILAALLLLLVLVASLVLLIPPLGRAWARRPSACLACLVTAAGAWLVGFGLILYLGPETPTRQATPADLWLGITAMTGWLGGTFLAMFGVVNAPLDGVLRRLQTTSDAMQGNLFKSKKPLFEEL